VHDAGFAELVLRRYAHFMRTVRQPRVESHANIAQLVRVGDQRPPGAITS
jgi:hypothetical protein